MEINEMMQAFIFIALLAMAEWIYLRIADKLNIIDKPNLRSSHSIPVVRGGGIIFPISWLLYSIWNGMAFPWFTAGLLLISTISFLDDMRPLSASKRFLAHLVSFALFFTEIGLWTAWPWWLLLLAFILCIGAINAFNFMDGINGITGMYALATFIPIAHFIDGGIVKGAQSLASPILPMLYAILIFGFYNFRKRARCFAGDVGSISLGFILIFILMMIMTGHDRDLGLRIPDASGQEWKYILFFSVYGVDSVLTILQRIYQKENIFEAHRKHLYQYMANESRIPHLYISMAYALIQFGINMYVIANPISQIGFLFIITTQVIAYAILKYGIIRKVSMTTQE